MGVNIAKDKLVAHGFNPGPIGMLALTAIDANNRGVGMRNVAAMAMEMPGRTKAAFSRLSKEVVVKAESIKKEDMAGVTAPMGFYDPLGYTKSATDEQLAFYREAELKHGRIGMVASLGIIAGEKFSPIFGVKDPARCSWHRCSGVGDWPESLLRHRSCDPLNLSSLLNSNQNFSICVQQCSREF